MQESYGGTFSYHSSRRAFVLAGNGEDRAVPHKDTRRVQTGIGFFNGANDQGLAVPGLPSSGETLAQRPAPE